MSLTRNPDDRELMAREHAAWLDVCQELLTRDVDVNIPHHEPLAAAIRKWGEELHQLRLGGHPHHDERSLTEKRAAYVGQFERGTYPEKLKRFP